MKKVVIITSGQPSLNPRMVKEADLLSEKGYSVTVLYQYWDDWATDVDVELLQSKRWKAIRVSGSPKQGQFIYWLTRLFHKLGKKTTDFLGTDNFFAHIAIARGVPLLIFEAKKHKADLYIGHNLAALPAAYFAARKNNSVYSFDAEDFHRNEMSDDPDHKDVKLKSFIEKTYYPNAAFITSASFITSEYYKNIFPSLTFTTVLNVFPKNKEPLAERSEKGVLKLFWFSQTVGLNRGLQNILQALKLLADRNISLDILGKLSNEVHATLSKLIREIPNGESKIKFHSPINPEALTSFASQFDIGFASEPGFSINNNIALSNKIFTYVSAGLVVLASETEGQKALLAQYPQIGKIYPHNDPHALSQIILEYYENRQKLKLTQDASYRVGQRFLNWEAEGTKFLELVSRVVGN